MEFAKDIDNLKINDVDYCVCRGGSGEVVASCETGTTYQWRDCRALQTHRRGIPFINGNEGHARVDHPSPSRGEGHPRPPRRTGSKNRRGVWALIGVYWMARRSWFGPSAFAQGRLPSTLLRTGSVGR